MTTERVKHPLAKLLGILALVALAFGLWFALDSSHQIGEGGDRRGVIEADVKSDFSRIRIRKTKNTRTLWFVRDSGEEVIESMIDLDRPHDLIVDYTRFMFLSYLFRPVQEKVLIVGLGGGSMVHFLKYYDPKIKIDVVEIDPAIVRLADKYFGVRSGGTVSIFTKDGFAFLKETNAQYDVIYMDAFLKPSRDTDTTGVPLRLKTIKFYKEIQKKLTADGLVVFNINSHETVEEDVKNIRDGFPQMYLFHLPNEGGYVVVGSMSPKNIDYPTLMNRAAELDRRFNTSYSYRDMVRKLDK